MPGTAALFVWNLVDAYNAVCVESKRLDQVLKQEGYGRRLFGVLLVWLPSERARRRRIFTAIDAREQTVVAFVKCFRLTYPWIYEAFSGMQRMEESINNFGDEWRTWSRSELNKAVETLITSWEVGICAMDVLARSAERA